MAPAEISLDWMRVRVDRGGQAERSAMLCPDERSRALRYRFEADRERFAAGRACLRMSLARWLGVSPLEVPLRDGVLGATALDAGCAAPAFSVSHSGDWAVVAAGAASAIGVDLERLREDAEAKAIARRIAGSRERADLAGIPPERAARRTMLLWTVKEAILKAFGCGLAIEPDRIELLFTDDERVLVLSLPAELAGGPPVEVRLVDAPEGYVAALAVIATSAREPTRSVNPSSTSPPPTA